MIDRELLQQALNVLTGCEITDKCEAAITAIRARLAQPEKEPVLWQIRHPSVQRGQWYEIEPERFKNAFPEFERRVLYTAPQPAAQPVPLTDEQIEHCWDDNSYDETAFARAIEAAHGIGEKK